MGMPNLLELNLSHCSKLKQLPEHGLTSLIRLTRLHLRRCACCCVLSLYATHCSDPPACAQHKH